MEVKWVELTEGTRSAVESALIRNCGWINVLDLSNILKGCVMLGYRWHDKDELSKSIFSVFRTVFTRDGPFHPQEQLHFVNCIYALGQERSNIPVDVKEIIFAGLEKRSVSAFEPVELVKLFIG
jgi:hypothetical protein